MQQRRRTSEAPSPSPRPLLLPFTAGKRVKREALSTTSSPITHVHRADAVRPRVGSARLSQTPARAGRARPVPPGAAAGRAREVTTSDRRTS